MSYCYRCRIALQRESQMCPLCHHKLPNDKEIFSPNEIFTQWRTLNQAHQHPSFWYEPTPISSAKYFNIMLDFIMLALFTAILILITINIYQINKHSDTRLSIYIPSVSLFYSMLVVLIIRLYRLTLPAQWLILLNTILFLVAIDLHDYQLSWSISSGLVIVFGGISPYLFLQMLWHHLRIKGLNIIGFAVLAFSISLVSLDAGISGGGRLQGWSLFTFSSLLFIAMLFLYLHYVAKIRVNFDAIMKVKRDNNKGKKDAR